MATYKNFYNKNINVKFYPDAGMNGEPVIAISSKKNTDNSQLRSFKEKLETLLQVKESNVQKTGRNVIFQLTIEPSVAPDAVEGVLKSFLHGGDAVKDQIDMNGEDGEKNADVLPSPSSPPQEPEMEPPAPMPTEEITIMKAFATLLESTYRTAKYWDSVSKAVGKPKQHIVDKDILSARKVFVQKAKGTKRDDALRSLDQAMKYFARKLRREVSPQASDEFKTKYRSIGSLTPHDYSGNPEEPDLAPTSDVDGFNSGGDNKTDDALVSVDFSDLFSNDEDAEEEDPYKNFQTQES